MAETTIRRYGPVNWSETVREHVKPQLGHNDDSAVTPESVQQWLSNFDECASDFRKAHESLISKIK